MKKIILVLIPVLVLILLSGCLDSNTTITVASDGSGKVEQTFMMKHEILLMLQSLGALGGEEDALGAQSLSLGHKDIAVLLPAFDQEGIEAHADLDGALRRGVGGGGGRLGLLPAAGKGGNQGENREGERGLFHAVFLA